MERKTKKHAVYSLEEKEEILELFLSCEYSAVQLAKMYNLDSRKRLYVWRDMKLKYGKIVDMRGKSKSPSKGRAKKRISPRDMTHEELISYVEMVEYIKKSITYLIKQK
ncbi:hypothetical protein RJG79_08915 [Mycoplasmatota bacterium WC44]